LREKKGVNIKNKDKEKREARRRLTIVVDVGMVTTSETAAATISIEEAKSGER
jgi:hypothetical protein